MHHIAFNFQGNAVLAVLAFLGTAGLLGAGLLAAVVSLARGHRDLARRIGIGMAAALLVYGAALMVFSLASQEVVLAPHDEKYFCEIDCHLAYSVTAVQHTRTLGPPDRPVAARGEFCLVTLQTRFDELTISPRRGREAPLWPNPRYLRIEDEQGRRFGPSPGGQAALDATLPDQAPLTLPLRPGESYTTTLAFDLPLDAERPRLLLGESIWPAHLLIGHEQSFLHKKTFFALL